MSWYEDAANEVGAAILAKDGPIVGPREVAAIIAKHDPNRWVPVSESIPPDFRPIIFVARDNHGYRAWSGTRYEGSWVADDWVGIDDREVTHWRPIILPEVKG